MVKTVCLLVMLIISTNVFPGHKISDVITSRSVESGPVEMDIIDVRDIFLGHTMFWEDGNVITVFTYPTNSIMHIVFLAEYFGMTSYRFNKIIGTNFSAGRRSNIKVVKTKNSMLLNVSSSPNSIGYLDADTILVHSSDNVRKIKIVH